MQAEEAITRINELVEGAENLRHDQDNLEVWRRKVRVVIDRIFGSDSQQHADLKKASFQSSSMQAMNDKSLHRQAFDQDIDLSINLLRSIIWEIGQFGVPAVQTADDPQRTFKAVQSLCLRFNAVVRQLRTRHDRRPAFDVEDEYDVQDLLHALLRLHFDDIRAEEWTPSYAGKSTRMDFLLKKEKIVVEVKKTRKGLDAKRLGEELIIDMAHYRNHSDCQTLICFVYDPESRIANPAGLESDLSRDDPNLLVRVIITPKS